MVKKIILSLVVIVTLFTVTACGANNNEQLPENKNETSQNEEQKSNEQQKQNENNKDEEENRIVVEEVINCDGCVYSYFGKEKHLGDTLSEDEYTTDINNIRTSGNNQRHNFFGFVLAGNKISKAYSCILKDNKIYCIQGSTDGTYHTNNISILNKIFTADQCKTISDGHTYTCTDGHYNGSTKTSGYASLHYETSCTIYSSDSNTGKLICN